MMTAHGSSLLSVSVQVFCQCVPASVPDRQNIPWNLSMQKWPSPGTFSWGSWVQRWDVVWQRYSRGRRPGTGEPHSPSWRPRWKCSGLCTPFWGIWFPLLLPDLSVHHKDSRFRILWTSLPSFLLLSGPLCWERDFLWEGHTARR